MPRMNGWLMLILAALLTACNRTTVPQTPAGDSVVAQVNKEPISVGDFQERWSSLPEPVKSIYAGQTGRKAFLEELITRELLLQKAHVMKLDQDAAFRHRVQTFQEGMLLDAVLRELVEKKVSVTDEEIQAYFEAHRNDLPPVEEAQASHILVKTEAQAKTLLDQLHRGANFSSLAKTHSQDPGTRDRGGDLGRIRKGQMIPEIERAVFKLTPGQTSDTVQSPHGYHIIRVRSRNRIKPDTADDVRSEIRQQISRDKQKTLFDDLARQLRAESRIEISESRLASIDQNPKEQ